MSKKPDMQFWEASNNLIRFLQSDAEAVLHNYQKILEKKIKSHHLREEHDLAKHLEPLLVEVISQREKLSHLSLTLVTQGMEPYREDTVTKPHHLNQ